jgi:hypothetical protein
MFVSLFVLYVDSLSFFHLSPIVSSSITISLCQLTISFFYYFSVTPFTVNFLYSYCISPPESFVSLSFLCISSHRPVPCLCPSACLTLLYLCIYLYLASLVLLFYLQPCRSPNPAHLFLIVCYTGRGVGMRPN